MAEDSETDDKTEDPTQKRLDEALERGDVVKSQELNTWFIIAGGTLILSTFSGSIGGGIMVPLKNLIANSWMIHADGPGLLALAKSLSFAVIAAIGVPILIHANGGDPAVIGAVGMLSGFCGTLMTPMAANFNIVPAALLELKDQNGVIKAQIPTALPLLAANIVILIIAGFYL